ncbi:hypothetical protein SLEP1_g29488 [Rubroshorea leprosula]|uniref:Uncharacterized protein n=1 Tax=Rubroshorea leprosula TaxID=152421 RepID=A0AAV5K366_9ROSI|nr:hypothetical protein SLEP1_g29488 [Rubroshorea leprosula]
MKGEAFMVVLEWSVAFFLVFNPIDPSWDKDINQCKELHCSRFKKGTSRAQNFPMRRELHLLITAS